MKESPASYAARITDIMKRLQAARKTVADVCPRSAVYDNESGKKTCEDAHAQVYGAQQEIKRLRKSLEQDSSDMRRSLDSQVKRVESLQKQNAILEKQIDFQKDEALAGEGRLRGANVFDRLRLTSFFLYFVGTIFVAHQIYRTISAREARQAVVQSVKTLAAVAGKATNAVTTSIAK